MKEFVDTNVIVYANDAAEPDKQQRAIELVTRLMRTGAGVISNQVLLEYAAVATRQLKQGRDVVSRQLVLLERLEVVSLSGSIFRNALAFADAYSLSIWDASILAAASAARCEVVWSEGLSHHTDYAGLRVRNPFE